MQKNILEETMQKNILLADFDEAILETVTKILEHANYKVVHVNGLDGAKVLLDTGDQDMLIANVGEACLDCINLLDYAKKNSPNTFRVIFSTFSNNKRLSRYLEASLAKVILHQSWESENLLSSVDKIFDLNSKLGNEAIIDLINSIDNLPTLPSLYNEISEMIENHAGVNKIAEKIEQDQSIASKILKIANSAFYNAKTGSIKQAIMFLGLTNVKNIVLSNSIFENFGLSNYDIWKIWNHSNVTNKLVHQIYSECLGKKMPNHYATAGLLHDIGKVLMLDNFPNEYRNIQMALLKNSNSPNLELEREYVGVDHQILGGYLLNWWDIPVPIVEAALYHDNIAYESILHRELVSVVHLANYYSWQVINDPVELKRAQLDVEAFDYLNITKDQIELLL